MARHRRSWALLAMVGLMLHACSGGDSSETTAAGGAGGAGGASDPGGSSGSPSGGTGETGGAGGSGGSGGTGAVGNADAGHDATGDAGHGDFTDAPPTNDAGEAGRCLVGTLSVVNVGSAGYVFNGGDLNAPLTLCRGNTYTFAINSPGHPFYIRTESGLAFESGVTGNFISTGDLVFVVPSDAPSTLFYQCDVHEVMTGAILIVD